MLWTTAGEVLSFLTASETFLTNAWIQSGWVAPIRGIPPYHLTQPCCCYGTSVMSDSVRPHRRQPTRLPCPWDSPGKNTGVGCHFLLQCMKVKSKSEVAQLGPTLCDPMDCSPPGSSIHGIFPGKSTGVGCLAAAAKSLQSCLTLCDPIDGSSPGSPVPGILQARTLE